MRYVALLLAVLFFANNSAAAARACVSGIAGSGQAQAHALGAYAGEPACPQTDGAGPCPKHQVQSHQAGENDIWAVTPALAVLAAPELPLLTLPAAAKLVVVASAPPVLGPPLTILYRNFRN